VGLSLTRFSSSTPVSTPTRAFSPTCTRSCDALLHERLTAHAPSLRKK
jgi:hypothetical protein